MYEIGDTVFILDAGVTGKVVHKYVHRGEIMYNVQTDRYTRGYYTDDLELVITVKPEPDSTVTEWLDSLNLLN